MIAPIYDAAVFGEFNEGDRVACNKLFNESCKSEARLLEPMIMLFERLLHRRFLIGLATLLACVGSFPFSIMCVPFHEENTNANDNKVRQRLSYSWLMAKSACKIQPEDDGLAFGSFLRDTFPT
jgi:hypothetical protein